jgi:hypothetical protein
METTIDFEVNRSRLITLEIGVAQWLERRRRDLVVLASPVRFTLQRGCQSFGSDRINQGPMAQYRAGGFAWLEEMPMLKCMPPGSAQHEYRIRSAR